MPRPFPVSAPGILSPSHVFVLASFSDDAPLPWSDLPFATPESWHLSCWQLCSRRSLRQLFFDKLFLLHSLPYSFHFANLCTSYSCHFSNLSTSLLFSFTTSLLSLFPTLRISRLFPFPAFFIRRFLTSPFFHFPTLFPFLASSGSNVASDLGNKDSALGSKSLESWIYGWRSLGLWNLWCKGFRVHGFRVNCKGWKL